MTTTPQDAPDVTIAARIPVTVRKRVEDRVNARAGAGETRQGPRGPRPYALSDALREAVDLWLDRERTVWTAEAVDLSLDRERIVWTAALNGNARVTDPDTAKRAAANAQKAESALHRPRPGSQRHELLRGFALAGGEGLTTDEAIARLERQAAGAGKRLPAYNGAARRVTDLLKADAIEPALLVGTSSPATRKTRHGTDAQVWTITAKGRGWHEELETESAAR